MWWLAILGCTSTPVDTDPVVVGEFSIAVETEPDPLIAGEEGTLWLRVKGPNGQPVPDLQQSHERMLHTFAISRDLASFQHPHHEDFQALTGEDLQSSTFHFPITFPAAGDVLLAFNYARENEYLRSSAWVEVEGEPSQLEEPLWDFSSTREVGDVAFEWVWDAQGAAGEESAWHLVITDQGEPVIDIVPWLATDGHLAVVSEELSSVGHTHAYIPGMEDMPPGHEMPHTYDGPQLPFRYVFPAPGNYRTWTQFARSGQDPITVAFDVQVP